MKAKILNRDGSPVEIELGSSLYREAHDNNCTVAQLLERKFGAETDSDEYGTVLEQIAANAGLFLRNEKRYGLRAPSIAAVLSGEATMEAGVIVREASPASRLVFPAVVLEMLEASLATERTSQPAMWESMIALKDTISGPRFEQPIVNYSRPEGARSQGIAQGALPPTMLTLTVADVARKIPTFSIGLEMTDEAAKATSLDFVTLSLQRQILVERDKRVEEYIQAMVSGDADNGQSALTPVASDTLHAATGAGALSHTAWMKFLYRGRRKRNVTHVMCDLATAMKIENREGKPTIQSDDPNSPRIDTLFNMLNPGHPGAVQLFLVDDGVVAADRIVALDKQFAIRRVRNSEAEYQAAEQFVLKKSSALRFDFGEICYRLFDDAWDVLDISA